MEDRAPSAALCLLEALLEEIFGSWVLKDWGWEHADAARTAKVSSTQRIVIPPLGLSRMIIVKKNSCGELTRLELKCVSTHVFTMGNYFPFLCSSTVMSRVIDHHKPVILFIVSKPQVRPRTNTPLYYCAAHCFPTVFGTHTWRLPLSKLLRYYFCTNNSLYDV